MIRLYYSAALYTVLGLVAGLYYRELTKAQDFVGDTQLSVVHTHLLALGMLFFLVILALENSFRLSDSRWFTPFFWIYTAGLVLTVTMLTVHGSMTVLGVSAGAAIAGIAGLGHILLTIGLALLFLALRDRVKTTGTPQPTQHARS
jgi:hypothetical protein